MFLDYCTLVECQGPRGCSRANKRLKADIKRSITDLKQNYNSLKWPLECSPAPPCSHIDQQQIFEANEHMPILKPDILLCLQIIFYPEIFMRSSFQIKC